MTTMRTLLAWACLLVPVAAADAATTVMLGRPTHESITANVRPDSALEAYIEYGTASGTYELRTSTVTMAADEPVEMLIDRLTADRRYFYRLRHRPARSGGEFQSDAEHSFQTQRAPGSPFQFAVQGDSHPERENNMFHPDLYRRTLDAVAADRPDFYVTSGDDFSVDTLRTWTDATVTARYTLQVPYLARVAQSSPIFLVNGNHEQAARYLLDGTANNVAVWAQNARNRFFPQPGPDGFYAGNTEVVPHIGLLRNYYAWEWGDALFVVIDPYWSSSVAVDGGLGGRGTKPANKWDITHGDDQYRWLKQTLERSRAKWKFVFAHHVLGTGRGGVEVANEFEWGGRNANGDWGLDQNRPRWGQSIHQLFVANGVTIFFQGHDHLFARQELDGVIYQSVPNPADNTYTAFNDDAYRSGTVLPNAGYLRVNVAADAVRVEYVREFLPQDESPAQRSGSVAFSYSVSLRR